MSSKKFAAMAYMINRNIFIGCVMILAWCVSNLCAESVRDTAAYSEEKRPLLTHAVLAGDMELINLLIQQGINLNAQDSVGGTALMYAVERKNSEITELLVKAGADVNLKSKEGCTALIWAVMNDDLASVKLLIEHGADVTTRTDIGTGALMHAKSVEMAAFLIKHGADVNTQRERDGATALMVHINAGNEAIAELLLSKGAEVNKRCKDGTTAFMVPQSSKMAGLLIKYGVDVNVQNESGLTALMYCASKADVAMVELLVRHGADIDICCKLQETAFNYVMKTNSTDKQAIQKILQIFWLLGSDKTRERMSDEDRNKRYSFNRIASETLEKILHPEIKFTTRDWMICGVSTVVLTGLYLGLHIAYDEMRREFKYGL